MSIGYEPLTVPQPAELPPPADASELLTLNRRVERLWNIGADQENATNPNISTKYDELEREVTYSFWLHRTREAREVMFKLGEQGWKITQKTYAPAHEAGRSDLILETTQVFPLTAGVNGRITRRLGQQVRRVTPGRSEDAFYFEPTRAEPIEDRQTSYVTNEMARDLLSDLERLEQFMAPKKSKLERLKGIVGLVTRPSRSDSQ